MSLNHLLHRTQLQWPDSSPRPSISWQVPLSPPPHRLLPYAYPSCSLCHTPLLPCTATAHPPHGVIGRAVGLSLRSYCLLYSLLHCLSCCLSLPSCPGKGNLKGVRQHHNYMQADTDEAPHARAHTHSRVQSAFPCHRPTHGSRDRKRERQRSKPSLQHVSLPSFRCGGLSSGALPLRSRCNHRRGTVPSCTMLCLLSGTCLLYTSPSPRD